MRKQSKVIASIVFQTVALTSTTTVAFVGPTRNSFVSSVDKTSVLLRSSSSSSSSSSSNEFELEDWRKFRATLIAREAQEKEKETNEEIKGELQEQASAASNDDDDDDDKASLSTTLKSKSVAKENERLLEEQNASLAKEYKTEVWAHLISEPEVGGLLCRMPIEGELYWGTGYWKQKLDTLLRIDTMGPPENQMGHWFQMAERMLARELEVITASAENGILNPNKLQATERELLEKYLDYKQTWQEVCLLLGSTQAIVLNRPLSKRINTNLAKLLLEGQASASRASTSSIHDTSYPHGFIDRFIDAFSEAAVYMGGPDLQAEPALMVHGFAELEGATELAPGTGIYLGGLEAAVDGILDGTYQPLDFRFFMGRKVFDESDASDSSSTSSSSTSSSSASNTSPLSGGTSTGSLRTKIAQGAYKPIACNRSLALKQCLGLPKPLWHEVLELCGGDMKAVSQIELSKRSDLR